MKKVFFIAVISSLAVALASCGASRKYGCPAVAQTFTPKSAKS